MKNKNKGISLIVLIITIIVMIILAGAVILSLTRSGIIDNTDEAKLKSNLTAYRDQLAVSISDSIFADIEFDAKNLTETSSGSIQAYIPSISEKDAAKYWIQRGEIVYSDYEVENNLFTDKKTGITENEKKFARELGIQRYAETFDETKTYSNIYFNPNPENPSVLFKSLKSDMSTVGSAFSTDNFTTKAYNINMEKKVEEGDKDNCLIGMIDLATNTAEVYFFAYEDITGDILENETEQTLKKGWNKGIINIADDSIVENFSSISSPPSLTSQTIIFADQSVNFDDSSWGINNIEFLGYLLSTKPY